VSWILIPSWVIIKFFLLFPVIELYFLVVVKSFYSDLKDKPNNNAQSVWKRRNVKTLKSVLVLLGFIIIYLFRIPSKATT
jgi:uncharacterized membrane protein